MNTPFHLFRLEPNPHQRDSESVRIVTHADRHEGFPLFRAPALPTPHQFTSELPFTINFSPRASRRSTR